MIDNAHRAVLPLDSPITESSSEIQVTSVKISDSMKRTLLTIPVQANLLADLLIVAPENSVIFKSSCEGISAILTLSL